VRLLLALAALLAVPGAASASTVSVFMADGCQGDTACSKYGGAPPVPITSFLGGPGEANRVTLSRDGGEFVVRDDGATLRAEAPCRAVDDHMARCPVTEGGYGLHGIGADLGDGGDILSVGGDLGVETSLFGAAGADSIEGGQGNDEIDGGTGADRLLGWGGFDELSYSGRSAPVVVDLAAKTAGEAGEGDAVAGFETLVGGHGDDVLRGAAAAETIDGGLGDDVLRGRGGPDALFGGEGADRLAGQTGDDRLYGDPGQGDDYYTPIIRLRPDRLAGGPGDDLLSDTGGRNAYLGGPGADVLEGGANADAMDAGAGPDLVRARGGGRDSVRCGAGSDRARTDRRDTRRSCERR
jgi:Ca2+-binding RTX toxin-like protein